MWHRLLNNTNSEAGDTIVEVLLALIIIGTVIAGAYTTSTRSLEIIRRSEERAIATKVAETHLETIKSRVNQGGEVADELFERSGSSDGFCFDSDDTIALADNLVEQSISSYPDLGDAELTSGDPDGVYRSSCVHEQFFFVHIIPEANDRFRVTVRWERFGGGGLEELQMLYGIKRAVDVQAFDFDWSTGTSLFTVEMTSDNEIEGFYINGQAVSLDANADEWGDVSTATVGVEGGEIETIAVKAKNTLPGCGEWGCNPAMLIFSIRDEDGNTVYRSGDSSPTTFTLAQSEAESDPVAWPNGGDFDGWSGSISQWSFNDDPWGGVDGFGDTSANYIWPTDGVGDSNLNNNRAYFYFEF